MIKIINLLAGFVFLSLFFIVKILPGKYLIKISENVGGE